MIDSPDLDNWHSSGSDTQAIDEPQVSETPPADDPPPLTSILDRHKQGKAAPDMRRVRINKTIRMPPLYSEMLRDLAFVDTAKQGRKVSESDLMNEALEDYFRERGLLIEPPKSGPSPEPDARG